MSELTFSYVAEDQAGKVVRGSIQAASNIAAAELLEKESLNPLSLKTHNDKLQLTLPSLVAQMPKLQDYATLSRNLSDLLNAGVPVAEAMALLKERSRSKPVIALIERLLIQLRAGSNFSEALVNDKAPIPKLMIALVAAGEKTGKLGPQLLRLAETLEASVKLRRDLKAQMAYPAALCVLILLTLFFLAHFVLPQFETIFSNNDATAPLETRIVLAMGHWIREYGMVIPLMGLVSVLLFQKLRHLHADRIDRMVLKLPMFGGFKLKLETGRYYRSLGALLEGGAPLATALPVARQAVSSPTILEALEQAEYHIRAGELLSKTLQNTNLFPIELIHIAGIGEKTGRLGAMLLQGADLCEQDIKRFLGRLTSLSGPILTAVMGLVTAGVIAAVMSGVLSLNDAII